MDAEGGVFDNATLARADAEAFGGGEVNFRVGFDEAEVFLADDGAEVRTQAADFQNDVDDAVKVAGGDGEFVTGREVGDELMEFLEDGPVLAEVLEEIFQFALGKVFEFVRDVVFVDEVAQQRLVGPAIVIAEDDAVIVFAAEFGEERFEGALVQRLAVDEYAIHVEDDGREILHPW